MHNISRLTESYKKITKNTINSMKLVDILFGVVVSEKPLEIELESKLILNKNQLIVTRNVTNHSVLTYETDDERLATKTYVFNRLKLNEEVILLRLRGGQKFLVLDRIGDIE